MARHRPPATAAPFDIECLRFLFDPNGWRYPVLAFVAAVAGEEAA